MNDKKFKYAYQIDLDSDTTPAKVVRLVGRDKEVLELGCGPGHMSRVFKEHLDCEVTGVEVDEEAATEARKHCREVIVCDLDRAELSSYLRGRTFDVIVMADVLEHLMQPERVLRQAKGLLKENGHVVISIPNVAYMGIVACLVSDEFPYSDLGLLDRTHLRFFTGPSFRRLLGSEGFIITEWQTYEVPVELTEFRDSFERLPKEIRQFISMCPDSSVYQFILSAAPLREEGAILGKSKDSLAEKLDEEVEKRLKERDNWFLKSYSMEQQVQGEKREHGLFKRLLSTFKTKR